EPPVLQLAHVEIARGRLVLGPAEEDVARRLHHALALDHAAALVTTTFRAEPLAHGFAGLLDLQEQRRAVAGQEQPDPAEPAHAADADHLERHAFERV